MIKTSALLFGICFFGFGLVVQCSAQTVPTNIKREISSQIDCGGSQYEDITSARVGPGKSGYIGQCTLGGNAFIWEKTTRGIKRIFSGERQMNGGITLGKQVHNGYYEVIFNAHGAAYFYETTFRWNGRSFVEYRSCERNSIGKLVNCKPS